MTTDNRIDPRLAPEPAEVIVVEQRDDLVVARAGAIVDGETVHAGEIRNVDDRLVATCPGLWRAFYASVDTAPVEIR